MTGTGDRRVEGPSPVELSEQLRALDDLEAELAAGDLDRADYETLRQDYTLRVADAVRRLDGAETPPGAAGPDSPPARRRRIGPVTIAVAVLFAVGAGWLLARSTGERGVNDALTGQIESPRQRVFECQDLGVDGLLVESLQCFDEVLAADPDNIEALSYRGWYVVLATPSAEAAGQAEEAAELLEVGQTYLDRAVELDPTFPDARAFRAVVYDRQGRSSEACAEVAALIELDPPPFFVDQTRAVAERNGC